MLKKIANFFANGAKKAKTALMTLFVGASVSLPAAAQDDPVKAAADNFASSFQADATTVGVTLISAAFFALAFKWVKGMVFS